MAECSICGEVLAPGSWTCSLCGTTVPGQATAPEPMQAPGSTQAILPMGEVLAPDTRLCPGCGQTYGPEYADTFCKCGMELILAEQLPAAILEETSPQGASPA